MPGTAYLEALIAADRLLKDLSVGGQVSNKPPFQTRPIRHLLKRLPPHLRRIIETYNETEPVEQSRCRFWIEAGDIKFATQDEQEKQIHAIAVGEPKMFIRKHELTLQPDGSLGDADEGNEGHPIYMFPDSHAQTVINARIQKAIEHEKTMIIVEIETEIRFTSLPMVNATKSEDY